MNLDIPILAIEIDCNLIELWFHPWAPDTGSLLRSLYDGKIIGIDQTKVIVKFKTESSLPYKYQKYVRSIDKQDCKTYNIREEYMGTYSYFLHRKEIGFYGGICQQCHAWLPWLMHIHLQKCWRCQIDI